MASSELPRELDRVEMTLTDTVKADLPTRCEELRKRGFVLADINYPPDVTVPQLVFKKYERTVQNLGDAELKRVSTSVRKAITDRYGVRGATFFMTNIEIVTLLFQATWIAIRKELESTGGR